MSLAVLLYEIEEWENAIEAFSKVIHAKDKYLTDALYYRGDCKYNLGNKETACIDWNSSANLGDDDARPRRKGMGAAVPGVGSRRTQK